MKTRIILWGMFLSTIILGCTTSPRMSSLSPSPGETALFPTRSENPSTTPTALSIVPTTPTITPTGTDSKNYTTTLPVSDHEIKQNCLTVLPEIPKNKTYPGKVILLGELISHKDPNNDYYNKAGFYDINTEQLIQNLQYKILDISVSPDRKNCALLDVNDHRIKVFSVAGNLLDTIPPGNYPWFISQWVDDQHIVLAEDKGLPNPRDVVVVNLSTGEQKSISSDYPGIDRASNMLWEGGSTTVYDPTLTRVVYPSLIEEDYIGNSGQGYILWDLVNKRKLVQIVTSIFNKTPKWSPDGSKFVINGENGEMYVVTREGKVSQITHLNPIQQNTTMDRFYFSERYSWSPDGRHIALWLESIDTNQTLNATLAILDTGTGEMTDYCISAGFAEGTELSAIYVPVWSPDGKYLVTAANKGNEVRVDTVFIDLKGVLFSVIEENVFPVGWLDTTQK